MSVIYEPKGRAREYSPLALNLFRGCGHGCKYCWAPNATFTPREIYSQPELRKDIVRQIGKDAIKLAGDPRPVLLCFTCDPYQPIEALSGITRYALEKLGRHGMTVQILTKGGTRAVRDFDILARYPANTFGSTLTFMDPAKSREWEPGAALPEDRIEAIRQAHDAGIRTWVSLEPVMDCDEALKIIEATHEFVDHYKVGKLNYLNLGIDWGEFAGRAVEMLRSLNKSFYVKKDLRSFCPALNCTEIKTDEWKN